MPVLVRDPKKSVLYGDAKRPVETLSRHDVAVCGYRHVSKKTRYANL